MPPNPPVSVPGKMAHAPRWVRRFVVLGGLGLSAIGVFGQAPISDALTTNALHAASSGGSSSRGPLEIIGDDPTASLALTAWVGWALIGALIAARFAPGRRVAAVLTFWGWGVPGSGLGLFLFVIEGLFYKGVA